jgi:hypothetical protein
MPSSYGRASVMHVLPLLHNMSGPEPVTCSPLGLYASGEEPPGLRILAYNTLYYDIRLETRGCGTAMSASWSSLFRKYAPPVYVTRRLDENRKTAVEDRCARRRLSSATRSDHTYCTTGHGVQLSGENGVTPGIVNAILSRDRHRRKGFARQGSDSERAQTGQGRMIFANRQLGRDTYGCDAGGSLRISTVSSLPRIIRDYCVQ